MSKLNFKNNGKTTLIEQMNESSTYFKVLEPEKLPEPPFRVTIDDEIIEVWNKEGNLLGNLKRGLEGTSSSSHLSGVVVENRFTAGAIDTVDVITDEGNDPDYAGLNYKLAVVDGKPYLKVIGESSTYQRPADWLPLPEVIEGEQKFVGLYAVFPHDSNFIALNVAGAYTVDWGDGSSVENFGSGVTSYHKYVYGDINPSTECSRGYRQVIVTITPQMGQNFTQFTLPNNPNQFALSNDATLSWLHIKMAGSEFETLRLGDFFTNRPKLRTLEVFEFIGTNKINSFFNAFNGCSSLQYVSLYTSLATSFNSMFRGCNSLQSIPLLDTSRGTDFASMFSSCRYLQSIPPLNTSSGTSFNSMFNGCYALQSMPLLNTSKCTNFSSMFNGCISLQSIPLLDTSSGTNFSYMFSSCNTLQSIPLLDTSRGTDFASMFNGCSSLQSIPPLDTSKCTNFSSMFNGCDALQLTLLLNTSSGTNFSSMFNGCGALQSISLLDTSRGTNFASMFSGCNALQLVVQLDVKLATGITSMFNYCYSLSKLSVIGIGLSISLNNCCLSKESLVDIFNNLQPAVSQTITITNNWGAPLLTQEDRNIAISKGWTIVG